MVLARVLVAIGAAKSFQVSLRYKGEIPQGLDSFAVRGGFKNSAGSVVVFSTELDQSMADVTFTLTAEKSATLAPGEYRAALYYKTSESADAYPIGDGVTVVAYEGGPGWNELS